MKLYYHKTFLKPWHVQHCIDDTEDDYTDYTLNTRTNIIKALRLNALVVIE